jgi:hypothetical protein
MLAVGAPFDVRDDAGRDLPGGSAAPAAALLRLALGRKPPRSGGKHDGRA